MHRHISINGGSPSKVSVTHGQQHAQIRNNGKTHIGVLNGSGGKCMIDVDGLSAEMTIVTFKEQVLIHAFGRSWRLDVVDPSVRALGAGEQSDIASAPMPGVAISVMVKPGDAVAEGQAMVIIESMKMQTEICASRAGTVDQVNVRVGETFPQKAPLVTLVPLTSEA